MAYVVTDPDFSFRTQGQHKKAYNLKQYLDGQVWSLNPGEDAGGDSPKSVRSSMIQAAKRQGCKARTNIVEGRVVVQKIN